jgi:hypothetical protein
MRAHDHSLPEPDQGWGQHLIDAHGSPDYTDADDGVLDPDRARTEHERLHAEAALWETNDHPDLVRVPYTEPIRARRRR